MSNEKFCLRWNDFENNISAGLRSLREEKDFFDVTLACDDSQLQAHKVILSACSLFFRKILKQNPHQHPLLYLKGVKFSELQSILNFMYVGEVNVAQDDLNSFLSAAEDLKVKGLTQNFTGEEPVKPKQYTKPRHNQAILPPKQAKYSEPTPQMPHQIEEVHEIEEVVHVKTEPGEIAPRAQIPITMSHTQQKQTEVYVPVVEEPDGGAVALDETYGENDGYDYQYEGYHEVTPGGQLGGVSGAADPTIAREEEITSLIMRCEDRKVFTCALCPFVAPGRHRVFCHIEAQHFADQPVTYTCQYCGKTASSKNGLCLHISRNHKQEREQTKIYSFSA